MWTHRDSISAVCGYSSLSIMFLSIESAISCRTSGSIHVVQKVARFWRELPSRISSSRTRAYATAGGTPVSARLRFGSGPQASGVAYTSVASSSSGVRSIA